MKVKELSDEAVVLLIAGESSCYSATPSFFHSFLDCILSTPTLLFLSFVDQKAKWKILATSSYTVSDKPAPLCPLPRSILRDIQNSTKSLSKR
jgi:hypothetical protein